jgi:transposase
MLGPAKPRNLNRSVLVSLESLVPHSHFYRLLDSSLDLSFVREWCADRYAPVGRPSIDPVVFFKLQLVMFFEGIRSERQLVEMASLNLAHRWYLGYNFDELLPDHSSLTRIRQRLGVDVFRRFHACREEQKAWARLAGGRPVPSRRRAGELSDIPITPVEWTCPRSVYTDACWSRRRRRRPCHASL